MSTLAEDQAEVKRLAAQMKELYPYHTYYEDKRLVVTSDSTAYWAEHPVEKWVDERTRELIKLAKRRRELEARIGYEVEPW